MTRVELVPFSILWIAVIAASRTLLLRVSGWGCRGRLLSRERRNLCNGRVRECGRHRHPLLAKFLTARSAVKGLANTLLKAGQVDGVIELLSAHLDREPRDWEAHRILAGAYLSKQRHASARAHFMQVLESLPSDGKEAERSSELCNDIGVTYFREQKLKDAEDWFKRSIRESSGHGTLPYRNLTHLYSVQERYREALNVLQECTDIFGDDEYLILSHALR
jgi:tetratricopeptide (TPR) repeat protein